jgi:membrane-bound inhibitor of C-type lysozyme
VNAFEREMMIRKRIEDMKLLPRVAALIAAGSLAAPAMAQGPVQPPMNQFYSAFYTCDGGGAFMVAYDSDKPETATMTTSNNNKTYTLKRSQVSSGAEFSDGATKFWTDGKTVTVDGTVQPYLNCKLKPS